MIASANVTWRNRDVLDFYSLFVQAWRGRWWIVGAAFCVAFLGWLVSQRTTPLYQATAVLVSVSAQRVSMGYSLSTQAAVPTLSAAGGAATLTRLGLDASRTATEEALAVLRSREFGYRFIRDLNLMPLLFADLWDDETGTWNVPEAERPTESDAFEYFDSNVRTIERDARTGLVTVQIVWRDREAAAAWTNEMVERLNAEMRQRAIQRANASLQTLEDQVESVTILGAREAVNGVIEAQVNERMLASVSDEFAFRIVDRALAPPRGEIVWPPTLLLVVAGWAAGSMLGLFLVIVFRAFRPLGDVAPART